MAAISTAHAPSATTTTITPPSSGHEDRSWDYHSYQRAEVTKHDRAAAFDDDATESHAFGQEHGEHDQGPYAPNGDLGTRSRAVNGQPRSRKVSDRPHGPTRERSSYDTDHDGTRMNGNRRADSFGDHGPSGRNGTTSRRTTGDSRHGPANIGDHDSKWIHRDKLAQIESRELQAAGFMLPKPRSHSRVRRDNRHHEQPGGAHQKTGDGSASEVDATSRSRTNSVVADQTAADADTPLWDLRLPDEIAEEDSAGFCTASGLSKGGTRIPVAKLSPAPIPVDYLERPTPVSRNNTNDGVSDADGLTYTKPRSRSVSSKQPEASASAAQPAKRSVTDGSPKKATGNRKPSSSRAASAGQRPKTRSGPNKDSTSRPSTRSGELTAGSNSSKQPEGDPPWMMNAYRPDPRLPPDQQLLPTVARRLQQEKWEKEGKFGNVLDKEFRPLNEEGFPPPPDKDDEPEPKPEHTDEVQTKEWPLREELARSYTPKPSSIYSTMPRVQDKATPTPASPPPIPMGPDNQQRQASPARRQEQQETEKQSKGCGCCVVM